jgi:Domain of Unknown Function (DUF928)
MNRILLGTLVGAIALSSTALIADLGRALPFSPPADNTAPRSAAGGASRGTFFTPPADNPAPRRAASGAARGDTPTAPSTSTLKGLMPRSFYGTTVSERPVILVYLAEAEAEEVMFSLKDEASNLQYSVTIPVSGAGVYAFEIPTDAPMLEVDKNYHWFAALKSGDGLTPSSPYVEGWIKRVEASSQLAESLAHGDDLSHIMALGSEGVWYDSVAKLAFLRNAQPQSEAIALHWTELLTSVGLEDISTAPLVSVSTQR